MDTSFNMLAISVVMPVYNGEKYIRESIESILNQTYTDYEFIIVNDGSNDKTEEIILSYTDKRIHYIKNEINLQIAKSLNRGFKLAKGMYIARMDADDISLPNRFEKQILFMEKNQDIGVCGTWLQTIGEKEEVWKMPVAHEEIAAQMFFNSCIMHPTAFIRTNILNNLTHIYSEDYNKSQDYELWTRLISITKLANLPEVLLKYRLHPVKGGRDMHKKKQKEFADRIRERVLRDNNIRFNDHELALHNRLAVYDYELTALFACQTAAWLKKIMPACGTRDAKKIIVNKLYDLLSKSNHRNPLLNSWEYFKVLKFSFLRLQCRLLIKGIRKLIK